MEWILIAVVIIFFFSVNSSKRFQEFKTTKGGIIFTAIISLVLLTYFITHLKNHFSYFYLLLLVVISFSIGITMWKAIKIYKGRDIN